MTSFREPTKSKSDNGNDSDRPGNISPHKRLKVLGTPTTHHKPKLKVGIILPSSIFAERDYNRVSFLYYNSSCFLKFYLETKFEQHDASLASCVNGIRKILLVGLS